MEVDAVSFPHHLLGILTALSESEFVSIDLELSGIASKDQNNPRQRPQSLEQRYQEIKACAEKYQILQVGITCAKFDVLSDKYILRPYNVNISPLLQERLDIERIWSFQSGAVEFLLRNGFQIDLPFTKGVPYLSREESVRAKEMAYHRINKVRVIEDLQLEETEVESLAFVTRVREAILVWRETKGESLDITATVGKGKRVNSDISRFEKRLVHQLVRAEFPDLITISKQGCIRIIRHDPEREAAFIEKRKRNVRESISRQTGFRWVIEGMTGGDLHHINPEYFCRNAFGHIVCANLDFMREQFRKTSLRLKQRQPVLVGHNMFMDLIYFYQCFIGPLPSTLEGFRKVIHDLFPLIVDTKYMVTHDCGDINPVSSLQETAKALGDQLLPNVVTHFDHSKYHDSEAHHEAGYDSLQTATVMIKLSANLYAKTVLERHDPQITTTESDSDHAYETAPEEGGVSIYTLEHPLVAAQDLSTKKQKKRMSASKSPSRFASQTLFEALRLQEAQSEEDSPGASPKSSSSNRSQHKNIVSAFNNPNKSYKLDIVKRDPMELIPDFEHPFWKTYGNQVRVFGTLEGKMNVGEWNGKRANGGIEIDLENVDWTQVNGD